MLLHFHLLFLITYAEWNSDAPGYDLIQNLLNSDYDLQVWYNAPKFRNGVDFR